MERFKGLWVQIGLTLLAILGGLLLLISLLSLHLTYTVLKREREACASDMADLVATMAAPNPVASPLRGQRTGAIVMVEPLGQRAWDGGSAAASLVLARPVEGKKLVVHLLWPWSSLMRPLGWVRAVISTYIILSGLAALLLGTWLLRRVVIRPLLHVFETVEKIQDGDLLWDTQGKRDLSKLSRSVRGLASRLVDNQLRLKEQVKALEAMNQHLAQAQEQLLRSEKLASVGRLAAGLAHEVGNPLGAILGYVTFLASDTEREDHKDILRRVETEIGRINEIFRSLLDYARPGTSQLEGVSAREVIQDALQLLRAHRKMRNIQIRQETHPDLPLGLANPGQLRQVLVNLLINASDAMGGQGEVLVKAHLREDNGKALDIQVIDHGPGIPPDKLGSIFDPFFTTKGPGEGTGLGLAIALRIVEGFGGEIRATSQPGEQTAFTVTLQVWEEPQGQ